MAQTSKHGPTGEQLVPKYEEQRVEEPSLAGCALSHFPTANHGDDGARDSGVEIVTKITPKAGGHTRIVWSNE